MNITLHDVSLEQIRALADLLGGDQVVSTDTPAPPNTSITTNAPGSAFEKSVPEAPAAPGASTGGGKPYPDTVEEDLGLDKADLPWDSRINAGSKKKKADGTWKLKPGVDKTLVEKVQAELAECSPSGPKEEAPSAPAPGAPGATVTPSEVLELYTKAESNGEIEEDEFNELLEKHGVANTTSLFSQPDAAGPVYADLKAYLDDQ